MAGLENLTLLEMAVDKLVLGMQEIKQKKLVLQASLESRDLEIKNLKEQLQVLQGERVQIDQRISSLLSSIEKWEKLTEAPVVEAESEVGVGSKTLF